ncbi:MAG: DNA polymerase III subunit delta [Candidatus Saccharimonadales bacterium]
MITTLAGENSFALGNELGLLVQKFLSEFDAMGLERIDGEEADFNKISEALNSLPFLAGKKLVVLRSASANKQFIESAEDLLKDLPETTDVILVEPKLDKRSSYYKFLKKATDFKEFNALDENGLARWLVEIAKQKDASISPADARFLVQRLGLNQELLKNSLDILLLASDKITRKTIEEMTEPTPQSKVFDLLEAAFNGRTKLALELYDDQRAQKVEPLAIIAMIAWQLKILAIIKAAGQKPGLRQAQPKPAEIAQESKINPFVINKNMALARQLPLARVQQLVADLLELDVRLKTESIDADEALRLYLLNLAS